MPLKGYCTALIKDETTKQEGSRGAVALSNHTLTQRVMKRSFHEGFITDWLGFIEFTGP